MSQLHRAISSERIVVTARERLELLPWQAPAPAAGEIRVRVAFSAVSFGDVMLRRHVFRARPGIAVPGYEVVGSVDAVGDGVAGWAPGDRIAAFIEYGGNARHALVRASDAIRLAAPIDAAQAAAVVLNYATALGMIEAAGLRASDDLLIHGATGGVGTAVLDTARALRLRAYGTTRRERPADLLGARLFDARSKTLVSDVLEASGGGVRAVFDPRAGLGLWRSRAMVRSGGALVVIGLSTVARRGASAAFGVAASLATLGLFSILPGVSTRRFAIDQHYRDQPERVRAWVARALDLLATGAVTPAIGATLPLAATAQAQRLVETGAVVGKVLIDCR